MTQDIMAVQLTHMTLCGEKMGANMDELIVNLLNRKVLELSFTDTHLMVFHLNFAVCLNFITFYSINSQLFNFI